MGVYEEGEEGRVSNGMGVYGGREEDFPDTESEACGGMRLAKFNSIKSTDSWQTNVSHFSLSPVIFLAIPLHNQGIISES